jgi:acyl-coenzyme A synthetase/AMP-(fatty) acid ligase
VSPLLTKLQQTVNNNIVAAATNPNIRLTGTPLAPLQPGNWATFMNAPDIPATESWWQVENTIVLPGGKYFGWPLGVKTEPELKETLMNKYNKGVDAINGQLTRKDLFFGGGMSKVTLQQIPGYVPPPGA